MLKKVLLGVAAGIALLVVILFGSALTQPDEFRVERSAEINAPPQVLYDAISDFHRWSEWSPWEKLDPNLTRTHSGAEKGVGAIYAWKGNDQVGEGRMEIVEATAPSDVRIKLDFISPFEAHNTAHFHLEPAGQTTRVTWAMTGPNPFFFKLMHLFMNMDGMVGKDFETGLANLKQLAEQPATN